MSSFFQELKRRNVFRVGVAYVVVAWLIIQVIETVSDPLALPEWTEAFFIVLLLAGLPVILIFSWAFELTPEGLKKTREVAVEESVTATTGKKLNFTIIAVLVMALGYSMWERQGLVEQAGQSAATSVEEVTQTHGASSVAVLPFVNMSADEEQEYFSDGISEELLNLLAKIPELRVPARTSSFQFKGQNLDIGKVAEQLNVEHVLEGSVRKSGVRVRVTAQLIEAKTGYHLWSDTYDRELDDIFAIQDEISAAIVGALSETLGLQASAAPRTHAAANAEAYNAYLLAQHQLLKRTKLDLESAIPNFELALEYDPDFAPAHAGLGLAWYLLNDSDATYGTLTLEESLGNALPHLERALELDPQLPEALGVMGLTLEARGNYEDALEHYEKALAINPSLTDARNWYSNALDNVGRPGDALREMERAYELDPLSVLTLSNYSVHLVSRRDFDKAEPVVNRLAQVDETRGVGLRSWMRILQGRAADGVADALRAIDRDARDPRLRANTAENLMRFGFSDAAINIWPFPDDLFGVIAEGTDLEYSLELAQKRFNNDPNNLEKLSDLAWANWNARDTDTAVELVRRYLDKLDPQRRSLDFANMILAFEAGRVGDMDEQRELLVPLNNFLDRLLASGVDDGRIHAGKAWLSYMLGQEALALEHMEKAMFRSVLAVETVTRWYEYAGWDKLPEWTALQERHRDYMQAEGAKLMAMACGPDGFEAWQPSAEACGRASPPSAPN